jgi:hypothetical protein
MNIDTPIPTTPIVNTMKPLLNSIDIYDALWSLITKNTEEYIYEPPPKRRRIDYHTE